jgi:hypothetical protein
VADQEYINDNLYIPLSGKVRDKFCQKLFTEENLSEFEQEIKLVLAEACSGKIEGAEFRQRSIDITNTKISRYLPPNVGRRWFNNIFSALEWTKAVSNPVSDRVFETSWEILIGELDPTFGADKQLIENVIGEFESLSKRLQDEFRHVSRLLVDGKYEEATRKLFNLSAAHCPPPHILFPRGWKHLAQSITLPAYLKTCIIEGKYEESAQTLANIGSIYAFAQKLHTVAEEGYLIDVDLPLFNGESPYRILKKHGIHFNASQKEIKALIVPERNAWNALRSIDKRLLIDWQVYPVSDAEFLQQVAQEAEVNLRIPDAEHLRAKHPENICDIFLILTVADKKEQAQYMLETALLDNPESHDRGSLCHLLGLRYFADAAAKASAANADMHPLFEKAIAYLVVNLMGDNFWQHFKQRRQQVYQDDVLKTNIANTQKAVQASIENWFTQQNDQAISKGKKHEAEMYRALRLAFIAEVAGAELLKKVGGIQMAADPAQRFIGGRLGVERFGLQDQLEGIVDREQKLNSGAVASAYASVLTSKELKLFPCLFSEYSAAAVLCDENPSDALQHLHPAVQAPTHPQHPHLVNLAIDCELQLAASPMGKPEPTQEDITTAICHWAKACQLAQMIDKGVVTRLQILKHISGRARYFYEQAQKASKAGRRREAIDFYKIAIDIIEEVQSQLFSAPEDERHVRRDLHPLLADLYSERGIEICNYSDEYQLGARDLRKAMQLHPHAATIRGHFLDALINVAHVLLIKRRMTEASYFYQEALEVAESGMKLHPRERKFAQRKEQAERGLRGELDMFE